MAHLIVRDDITSAWRQLLHDLLTTGSQVSPRGFGTREILNVSLEVKTGLNNIIVSSARDLNYRFMVAEWLWIYAGLNSVHTIAKYNSVMKQFSDDHEILNGAYGPRIMSQIDYVAEALNQSDSRQAVATIWTPSPGPSKDIPCTISLQWLIRQGQLHCTVNMRSSDVWLGLPYDYFTFSQLTNCLSARINVPVGSVTMNLASSHLYDKNSLGALKVLAEEIQPTVTSPNLNSNNGWPTRFEIEQMLQDGLPYLFTYQPWHTYQLALNGNKKEAFELLSDLIDSEVSYVTEAE